MHLLDHVLGLFKIKGTKPESEFQAADPQQQTPAAALFNALSAAARQLQDTHVLSLWSRNHPVGSIRNQRALLNRRVKHQRPPKLPKQLDVCGWQTTVRQLGSVLCPEELAVELVATRDFPPAVDWRLQTSAAFNSLRRGSYLRDISLTGVCFGLNRSLKLRLDLESDLQGNSRATTEAALQLPVFARPVLTAMVGGDVRGGGEARGCAFQWDYDKQSKLTLRWFSAEGFGTQAVYHTDQDFGAWRLGSSVHLHQVPGCDFNFNNYEYRVTVVRAVRTEPRKAAAPQHEQQAADALQVAAAEPEGSQAAGEPAAGAAAGARDVSQGAGGGGAAAGAGNSALVAAGGKGKEVYPKEEELEFSTGGVGWRDAWEVTGAYRFSERHFFRIGFNLL